MPEGLVPLLGRPDKGSRRSPPRREPAPIDDRAPRHESHNRHTFALIFIDNPCARAAYLTL